MFLLDFFGVFCAGWLWPLLWLLTMALLGGIIGWLLRGGNDDKDRVATLEADNSSLRAKLSAGATAAAGAAAAGAADLKARISGLEGDLSSSNSLSADLKGRIAGLEGDLSSSNSLVADLRGRIAGLEADLAACNEKSAGFVAAMAPVASTKDDLKKIEGIGPKIEGLLNDDGIQTFAKLAETPVSRLKGVLTAAGDRYKMHDPGTWPKQGELARDGRWHELNYWQDLLDGGKGPEFDSLVIPPPSTDAADDLKKIEGIGPAIEKLLHKAGIKTFAQLADTDASRIREVLIAAGERFRIHDPKTWPEQSAMARDGRWNELKVWQDELDGGK
ncbi:MAG: helix-hairpin-helix domain-containing protein [Bacteroidia bacterium]